MLYTGDRPCLNLLVIEAEARVDEGKGASRRLRRLEGKTPPLFMAAKARQSISLIRKDLEKMLESEAFYTAYRTNARAEKSRHS